MGYIFRTGALPEMPKDEPRGFGSYWDEILDNKNALIKHLMDENRRLEKENEKLKREHLA